MNSACRLLAALAPLVLVATGCSGTGHPNLPPRPLIIRLDGITNVCGLLTAQQREQLDVDAGSDDRGAYQGAANNGPNCAWTGLSGRPTSDYSGALVLDHGAAAAQGIEPSRQVGGFAAVLTAAPGFNPDYHCGLMVDVAPDQTLMAEYGNSTRDFPGMNRQLACDKAQQLAEMLLTNLRTRLGR
ncbi:MAG TPA: DUF3558 family protein [Pseudonocardia sp.]|nr:DUF3558 family protein [Pseudonocardia sp.]